MMDIRTILRCMILLYVINISTQECTLSDHSIDCENMDTSPDIIKMNPFGEKIIVVRITNSNFTSLNGNGFQSPYLTHITIMHTALRIIEPSEFNNIPNLEYLYLGDNNISTITKGVFNNLTSLKNLHLSFNNIRSIEKNSFKGTNIKNLFLEYNKIVDMSFLVENCDSYETLNLEGNNITYISSLSNCACLRELNIQNNNIVQLQNRSFPTSLSILNLQKNQIERVEDDTFAGLTTLETLNLGSNNLFKLSNGSIPLGLFQSLTGLKNLYLNNNRLSDLVPGTFRKLTHLTYLNLGFNFLKGLSSGLLNHLPLTHLVIRHNELTSLENNFFNTDYTITIDLDGNEWSCEYLFQTIRQINSVNSKNKVIDGNCIDTPNINGIKCNHTKPKGVYVTTGPTRNQKMREIEGLNILKKVQNSVEDLKEGQKETNMLLLDIKDLLGNIAEHLQQFTNSGNATESKLSSSIKYLNLKGLQWWRKMIAEWKMTHIIL